MRRAARIDATHVAIVEALRKLGCSVQSMAGLGDGVPDLLCAIGGINFLVEVKDGSKPPSKRKLTPDQEDWIAAWHADVYLCRSIDDAIAIVGMVRKLRPALSVAVAGEAA